MTTELAPTETPVSIAGFDKGAAGVTPPSNPDRRGVFLADVVVELGLADQETIDSATKAAQEAEKSLERYLLDAGILDEERLSRAIAERNGLDHVDLDRFEVDMEAAELVSRSVALRYSAVPVALASDGALIVAVEDPFDTLGINDIEVMTRSQVRPAIATASGINALIERLPEQPVSKPPPPAPPPELPEPMLEPPPSDDEAHSEMPPATAPPDPAANGAFGLRPFPEPEPEPEVELELLPEPLIEVELEPEVEDEPDPEVELEFVPEPMVEVEQEPEVEVEPVVELEPLPEPEVEPEPEPGPEILGESDPGPSASGELRDLSAELRALQETARRSDELALTVEQRVDELKRADDRSQELESALRAAERRVEELESQLTGVDAVADELRATTEKLEEVNRVLEGSAR